MREMSSDRSLRPKPASREPICFWRHPSQTHVLQAQIKDELQPRDLEKTWVRVKSKLDATVEEVLKDPANWIPCIEFEDIVAGHVGDDVIAKIRRAGVLKIRGVVSKNQAQDWNRRIMDDFKAQFRVDPCECVLLYVYMCVYVQMSVVKDAVCMEMLHA